MEESWRRWSSQEMARLSPKTLQYWVCMSTHFLLKPLTVVSYHIREVRIFSLSSHNSQKSLLLVECCSDCYEPCTQLSPEGHVCHFMDNNLWIVWAGWAATSLMVWFFSSTQSITQDSWNILISLLKPPLTSNTLGWWSWGEVRNALQWLNREFFVFLPEIYQF